MVRPAIHHHTGLESGGGATRVARLLIEGLTEAGYEAPLSFELAEEDGAPTAPGDFGTALPQDAIPHLHCSGDWPALLGSIPEGRKTVVTLHDCELFTGGCPHPLGCDTLDHGCGPTCMRAFPDSADLRKEKYRLLHRLKVSLVSPSRWLARLAKTHLHMPVTVIPNGIPWPEAPPRKSKARKELGINTAARVALFVAHGGEEAAYKHGDQWHNLWDRIRGQVPGAICFAVGGQTAEQDGDFIRWPYVDRHRLGLLMSAADVLLYPTRADNHSLVVLEAMSCGLPVISFEVGGVPEQITDQETGLLVPPFDMDDFARQSIGLLAAPTRCRELGQNAFFTGRKRFAATRMLADYQRLYDQLG